MFTLVFENENFVVINKHPDVSVHKDKNELALVSEVAKYMGDESLYLIHRLDKMTSGLLLLGRHQQAASTLSSLFSQRQIEKYYLALSAKKPNKKQGAICGDMAKSRRSMWKLLVTKNQPAMTQFFSTSANENQDGMRFFLCKPLTGKTHQIRVALKSLGSAILGDDLYGGEKADRGYLHAYTLRFYYQQELFSFVLPPDKGHLWQSIPKPWLEPHLLSWPKINIPK